MNAISGPQDNSSESRFMWFLQFNYQKLLPKALKEKKKKALRKLSREHNRIHNVLHNRQAEGEATKKKNGASDMKYLFSI